MGLGCGHKSAKFDLTSHPGIDSRGSDTLLPVLQHGTGVATAAGIMTLIADGDFGDGEGLIMVWGDNELLNALGRISKDRALVPTPSDVSADRQLVDLLLAWRVNAEPLRDGARHRGCSPRSRANVLIGQSTRKRDLG